MTRQLPLAQSRQRAAEAFALRSAHWSWREIVRKLDYGSIGAAQSAVKAHVDREQRDPTQLTYREQVESVRLRSRLLSDRFADAYLRHDDDRLVALNRELVRNGDQLAKLTGTFAPDRHEVTVSQTPSAIIDETEARLLRVIEGEIA